jgi:hypothetical protein
MKKLNYSVKIFLIFMSSFMLFSCTISTDLVNWRDASYNKKFKKILVVALIKDMEFRKAYEGVVSQSLLADSVSASGSLNLLSYSSQISKAELEKVLADGKYDGLMILKYEGTKTTDILRTNYYDYYGSWYGYQSGPAYIERHKTVNMETVLFSVEKKKAVWAGQSKTRDAYSPYDLAQSVADEIVLNLKGEKLIK